MKVISCLVVCLCVTAVTAATGSWKLTSFQTSIAMGVGFSSADNGVMATGANGAGAQMLYTKDGGNNWNVATTAKGYLFLACDAQADSAVSSGLFEEQFSMDMGSSYNKSSGGGGPAQSVRAFGTKSYGVTGSFGLVNGVAVSTDGGATFTPFDAKLTTSARYGAFVSDTTWYVAAGTWPSDNNVNKLGHQLSERIFLETDPNTMSVTPRFSVNHEAAANGSYAAEIAKTTDGGKTWTTVFSQMGEFYFNQIDCASEDVCFAVAEADSGAGAGARIFRTTDGGSSWDQVHFDTGAAYSLMAVKVLSANEAWAAGCDMSSFIGRFYHTTDGGKTWEIDTLTGAYGNDLAFVGGKGFATVFLQDEQSSFAIYN